MLRDLGWLKRVKLLDTSDTLINPATNEKLNELKILLQAIDSHVDGLELTAENVNLNTDELEAKVQSVRDQLDVLLSTRASETTLIQVRDYIDTIEIKLQSLLDGVAKIKLWDGTNVAEITSEGRVKVDVLSGYKTRSSIRVVDTLIPINIYHTLLDLTGKSGISEEIHIVCETVNFKVRIEVDGEILCDDLRFGDLEDRLNLISVKGVTATYHQTYSRKDFHCNLPIYFSNSLKIQIVNNDENNKNLFGSSIIWRESI